jgi:hypothetical protein
MQSCELATSFSPFLAATNAYCGESFAASAGTFDRSTLTHAATSRTSSNRKGTNRVGVFGALRSPETNLRSIGQEQALGLRF